MDRCLPWKGWAYPPIVEFVRVFHTHFRCGVATALLDAARQRWPDLELTRDTSLEGKAFLAAYLAYVEKQGMEGEAFAVRNRRLLADVGEQGRTEEHGNLG